MRIATNRALSHIAARPPAADGLDAAGEVADTLPRPDELAARMQTAGRLQRAVRELPLALRQVMVLAFEGFSNEDIAAVLGLTAGNVGVRPAPRQGLAQGNARRNDMSDPDLERWASAWRDDPQSATADLARMARRERRVLYAWIAVRLARRRRAARLRRMDVACDRHGPMRFAAIGIWVLTRRRARLYRHQLARHARGRPRIRHRIPGAWPIRRSQARLRYVRFGW